MNEKSEKMLNDLIKTIERWTIEARIKELKLITKKLIKNQEPIDVYNLLKWIGYRKDRLEKELKDE